jgi:hypothetical protein
MFLAFIFSALPLDLFLLFDAQIQQTLVNWICFSCHSTFISRNLIRL